MNDSLVSDNSEAVVKLRESSAVLTNSVSDTLSSTGVASAGAGGAYSMDTDDRLAVGIAGLYSSATDVLLATDLLALNDAGRYNSAIELLMPALGSNRAAIVAT